MDNNENQMFQNSEEAVILKEKKNTGSALWYWIVAILVLGILTWFAITSGWFKSLKKDMSIVDQPVSVSQNGENELVHIKAWQMQTTESFPVGKTLILSGELANSCVYIDDVEQALEGNVFNISLITRVEEGFCTEMLVPFEKAIELDVLGLPAGVYIINVDGQEISFELEQDNVINFEAGGFK